MRAKGRQCDAQLTNWIKTSLEIYDDTDLDYLSILNLASYYS